MHVLRSVPTHPKEGDATGMRERPGHRALRDLRDLRALAGAADQDRADREQRRGREAFKEHFSRRQRDPWRDTKFCKPENLVYPLSSPSSRLGSRIT